MGYLRLSGGTARLIEQSQVGVVQGLVVTQYFGGLNADEAQQVVVAAKSVTVVVDGEDIANLWCARQHYLQILIRNRLARHKGALGQDSGVLGITDLIDRI